MLLLDSLPPILLSIDHSNALNKVRGLVKQSARDRQDSMRVVVDVRGEEGRQVGGVGTYSFTGRDTLLKVLVKAGPNNIAWTSRVKVIRPSPLKANRREIVVDVKEMLDTGDTRMNILLEPGDIVYVPPTPLGWIGLKIRELLSPVDPVLRAVTTPAVFAEIDDVYKEGGARGLRY